MGMEAWAYGVERSQEDLKWAEGYLSMCEEASEAWEGRGLRGILTNAMSDWILLFAPWRIFVTLTFRDETPVDMAWKRFYRLVRALNESLVGRHYTKKVGHSYFGYAVGMEHQARGVVHFHALIDRPVDFSIVHRLWNVWAGWAHTDVIESYRNAVRYVAKYTFKGGDVKVYRPEREWVPEPVPAWWSGLGASGLDGGDA